MASAAASEDVGGRVGAEADWLRRAAGVAGAWPPRDGRALAWSGRDERERAWRSAEAGQTRAGLGWAKARWAGAGTGGSLGRLRPWGEKRGGGP